ncbi:MAG TPA: DUF2145 domain-containing protein [Gallionella sp.]|nr:DUF2145 domain-containing protein [Gallionella sp.]
MNAARPLLACAVLLSILISTPSFAGSQAGGEAHFPPEQIIKFSKQMERTLAEKGARVAIVARVGRPPSDLPEGMHFTHVSFAVYSEITTGDGRKVPGYAIYNLYQRNEKPDTSSLIQDFPVDFFAGAAVLEAGIVIPSAELQKRLLETIASPTYKRLHDPHYSAIANPFTLGRQNCTEHTLDVVNAAIYQTSDIKRIKASEKVYFEAQPVNVGPLKLMLGSLFSSEITLSDQPDTPVTATFETIAKYLEKYDEGAQTLIIKPEL